jgi:uncharacterized Ntn-hydrolase superfamily protein
MTASTVRTIACSFCAATLCCLLIPLCAAALQEPPDIATFSVAAYNPATGEVGVAVQSRFFAVGSVVPFAKAGVGAVATQAFGYELYGRLGLELMAEGFTPEQAIEAIRGMDAENARRQVGMVSVMGEGLSASFTGDECMDWAGGLTGTTPDGIVYAVQGNILTGQEVVGAMALAMEQPAVVPAMNFILETGEGPEGFELTANEQRALKVPDFAGRLLGALLAGQAMGGDSRGMQSSAMYVEQAGAGYGGFTDVKYDLRVDDAADPFDELARLLNLARPFVLITDGYNYAYSGQFEESFAVFEGLLAIDPEDLSHHYHYACALALSGDIEAALAHLKIALEFNDDYAGQVADDPDLESLHELDAFWEMVPEQVEEDQGVDGGSQE